MKVKDLLKQLEGVDENSIVIFKEIECELQFISMLYKKNLMNNTTYVKLPNELVINLFTGR